MARIINEARKGDSLYVLEEFHASPRGEPQEHSTAKRFFIGERVQFVSCRSHDFGTPGIIPTWMITVKAGDVLYEATTDFFITQDGFARLIKAIGSTEEVKKVSQSVDKYSVTYATKGFLSTVTLVAGAVLGFWLLCGFMYWVQGGQ